MPLVGYLAPIIHPGDPNVRAFRAGLTEQGLADGRDLHLVLRSADGDHERLPALAAELIELGAAVLVAPGGTRSAQAARRLTDRVPIVINGPNALGMGWAASSARPGGNVTGQWRPTEETVTKSIELLADSVPSARRMASLANLSLTTAATRNQVAVAAAEERGLDLMLVDVPTPSSSRPSSVRSRGVRSFFWPNTSSR